MPGVATFTGLHISINLRHLPIDEVHVSLLDIDPPPSSAWLKVNSVFSEESTTILLDAKHGATFRAFDFESVLTLIIDGRPIGSTLISLRDGNSFLLSVNKSTRRVDASVVLQSP